MTLKTFLNESVTYDDLIKAIKDNNMTGRLIWRGMKRSDEEFGIKSVRKDRKSLSNYPYHYVFNDAFKEKFGHKLRSETLFVTKDFNEAANYGKAYAVIPKDKPKFYYSPNVKDLFSYDQRYFANDGKTGTIEQKIKALVDTYIEETKISDIKSKYTDVEIMILCNEYYFVDMTDLPFSAWEEFQGLLQYLEEF